MSYEDERGCTCFLGHAPCGWCENAPDPDSEAGLRRELFQVQGELLSAYVEIKRLRTETPADSSVILERDQLRRRLAECGGLAREAMLRSVTLACLGVALSCVGQLAAERAPMPSTSRFGWLEVD